MQATLYYGVYTLPPPLSLLVPQVIIFTIYLRQTAYHSPNFPQVYISTRGHTLENNYNFLVKKNWNFKHSTVLELSLSLSETAKPVAKQTKIRFG